MEDFQEKRKFFRVDLINDIPATAKISSINNRKVEVEKTFPIAILDLSTGGIYAFIPVDIPVNIVIIDIMFTFENEEFSFNALIIRKTPKDDGFEYGMKFLFHSQKDESRITRCLNQYKIKHTRFMKIQLDLRKQKYIGCFVKGLELIEEPAYLITSRRIVVATNKAAQDSGVKLGERCYSTVAKRHHACPFCLLEDAKKADHLLETNAVIREQSCKARWLYLEDHYMIHYFTRKEGLKDE